MTGAGYLHLAFELPEVLLLGLEVFLADCTTNMTRRPRRTPSMMSAMSVIIR
jgi:hypothetical protein